MGLHWYVKDHMEINAEDRRILLGLSENVKWVIKAEQIKL